MELDALLSETRHQAILEALEVWRADPARPREGVLALEKMALAGPQLQTFEWPDLDYPATLSEVCGSYAATPASSKGFDAGDSRGFGAGASRGFDAGASKGFDAAASRGFDASTTRAFDAGDSRGFDAGASRGFTAAASQAFDAAASGWATSPSPFLPQAVTAERPNGMASGNGEPGDAWAWPLPRRYAAADERVAPRTPQAPEAVTSAGPGNVPHYRVDLAETAEYDGEKIAAPWESLAREPQVPVQLRPAAGLSHVQPGVDGRTSAASQLPASSALLAGAPDLGPEGRELLEQLGTQQYGK